MNNKQQLRENSRESENTKILGISLNRSDMHAVEGRLVHENLDRKIVRYQTKCSCEKCNYRPSGRNRT